MNITIYTGILLLLCLGVIVFFLRMYENFVENHKAKMSFPNPSLQGKEKYLNSIHIPHGWRNAYLSGGGNPLFRVPKRNRFKELPTQTKTCNYPFKNNLSKNSVNDKYFR